MGEKCFLFEGQGAQFKGMGREVFEAFPAARTVFHIGSEVTGTDLQRLCFETEGEDLNRTDNSQLAVFTVSMAIFEALKEKGFTPSCYAGFSLGECSAFCAAGVFPLREGFALVKKRGELMHRCAGNKKGAMYAVIGLEDSAVEQICAYMREYVVPVNYNCPGQLVIAGDETGAEIAAQEALKKGAKKAVRLPVEGAFHSKHMQEAAGEFCEYLKGIEYHTPNGAVYSNIDGRAFNDFSCVPEHLSRHMTSPVRWEDEIRAIINDTGADFYEIGCSKTLTQFNRRIEKNAFTKNLSAVRDITEVLL